MSFTRKTAAFALLGTIGVVPVRDVTAQVIVHPKVLSSPDAHLPQIGNGKYSAEMFLHLPGLGNGTAEMIVSDNKMRYHASFKAGFIWETDWIDFTTDQSIQKQHVVYDRPPTLRQTFIASLNNVAVERRPDTIYKGYPVQVYHIDHQKVTRERAFDGDVYMYRNVPLLIEGSELNFTRPKCDGTWEKMRMEVIGLHMDEEQNKEALKPPTVNLSEARADKPVKVCPFP